MIGVPPELAEAIHSYLLTRPMREVEQIVAALRECRPIPAPTQEVQDEAV